uniref:Uncharacterized protein n=1 Tax=Zea mays TaxID=4577 RepID=C4J832_MAIZE|nr:unknown [Zea mays]
MCPPSAWPMSKPRPQTWHRWLAGAGAGFAAAGFVAVSSSFAGAAACMPSARPWRARRWLVRCPPSAWNDPKARLHVLQTNSPPAARRGFLLMPCLGATPPPPPPRDSARESGTAPASLWCFMYVCRWWGMSV